MYVVLKIRRQSHITDASPSSDFEHNVLQIRYHKHNIHKVKKS